MEVLKPFNTRTRRIAAGETITEADDLSPHTIDSLVAGKFIGAPEKPTADNKRRKA
ncbi:MAG: hypothetical protein WA973_07325 [Mesorhizobium sp.]